MGSTNSLPSKVLLTHNHIQVGNLGEKGTGKITETLGVVAHVCLPQKGQHSSALSWSMRAHSRALTLREERTQNKLPLPVNKTTCKPTVKTCNYYLFRKCLWALGYKNAEHTVPALRNLQSRW